MADFKPRTFEDLLHEFPPDIEHLSATGMKMALRCEEQYRRVYIKGQRKPPSLAMAGGRADHKAIEVSMRQKIDSGEDLPSGELAGLFLQEIESEVERVGGLNELEDSPDVEQWDQARIVGMDGVRRYNDVVAPQVLPLEVEEAFTLWVPEVPVPLVGYLDLRAFLHGTGEERIIDRKRSGRSPGKRPSPEWLFQASIYQLATPLPHDWHVTIAPKTGRVATLHPDPMTLDPVPKARTQRMVALIAAKIGMLYQRFGPDEEWPATGVVHPFACSYCGFRSECFAWK